MNKQISKRLSYILRHDPGSIQAEMDSAGWISVDTILAALKISKPDLDSEIETNNKKRFEYNEDQSKIRARQGHSLDINLGYEAVEPPRYLYHGTAEKNIPSIKKDGIKKMNRHHVHLSEDAETAIKVGERHGKATVITIFAQQMWEGGIKFYKTENNVWLTEHVASEWIMVTGYCYKCKKTNGLFGIHTHCPNCDSPPENHEIRNYSMMWHEGDIHCKLCGTYVRMYDAG